MYCDEKTGEMPKRFWVQDLNGRLSFYERTVEPYGFEDYCFRMGVKWNPETLHWDKVEEPRYFTCSELKEKSLTT